MTAKGGVTLLAGLMISVLALLQPLSSAEAERLVSQISNSEDLAPTADGRWVFADTMLGGPVRTGSLSVIDVRTGRATVAYPRVNAAAASTGGCPSEVPSAKFAPHGLALSPDGETLYVVNHGARESIEMFRVLEGSPPALRWIGCALTPSGFTQNAVAPTRDGTIFVTVMPDPVNIKDYPTTSGRVLRWSAEAGWRAVPGTEVTTANGIVATPDGRVLFVDAYARHEIVELSLDLSGVSRKVLPVGFMPDNIRWGRGGTLLVAGQVAAFADIVKCYRSNNRTCAIASRIAEVNAVIFSSICERSVTLPFATTAVPVANEVWLSSIRSDSVHGLGTDLFSAHNCERGGLLQSPSVR